MNLEIIDRRQINNLMLDRAKQVRLCCEVAKEFEEAGDYEAARHAMSEVWQRIGERPKLDDLDQGSAAEVLLRAGVLSGWIGSAKQIEGAQEFAKNLISESAATFEALQLTGKVAEARIDLAICYWREGAFDEARVTLQDVLRQSAGKDSDQRARALLNSAIVEISATRFNDALHFLIESSPLFEVSDNHAAKGRFHNQLALVFKKLSVAEQRDDYRDRAFVEYAAASFHFEQAGNTRYCARVENNLGFLYSAASRFAEARTHLDRARRLFEGLKDRGSVAQVDETRARVMLCEKRNAEAEKVARAAVRMLEQGDEQSLLAEALTTHGVALARTKQFEEARAKLQRAVEVAHLAGDADSAGVAALTILEEMGECLSPDEHLAIYERADQLLVHSQQTEILTRLRVCARGILSAKHGVAIEENFAAAPRFVYAAPETAALLRHAYHLSSVRDRASVLITGETGTGKEMLARMIHEWSGRAGEFVVINCAALTDTLVESQLFGHQKGSFADAHEDHAGAARAAAGGTLFLDEIGELSLANQAKILRLVEYGEVHSLGASMPERVNVQIIASTSRNLKELLAKNLFRNDLFYRLSTFHLELPPLRERPADIAPLAELFFVEAMQRHGKRVRFATEAMNALRKLPLRGNARELRALIEQTLLAATDKTIITKEAIETIAQRQTALGNLADAWLNCSLEEEVRRYEGGLIKLALEQAGGRVTRAARLLGVTHQGLAFILDGRHQELLAARKPVKRRKRSIIRKPASRAHG